MRGTSASRGADGKYRFYCRSCKAVTAAEDMPNICRWCGSILIDQGVAISGDCSLTENASYNAENYPNRGQVICSGDPITIR